MSQQFIIYMTPRDLPATARQIFKCGPYQVLHYLSKNQEPRFVSGLEATELENFRLSLYLARPEDIGLVIMEEVPAQGYWTIDVIRSPVIQFSKCFFDGEKLRAGRLYVAKGYYGESGGWVEKPAEFLYWAQAVFKSVKKGLTYDSERRAYFGGDALSLVENNSVTLLAR
jgi:hypothetical protein